jgi:type I restriction enzyme S subunit
MMSSNRHVRVASADMSPERLDTGFYSPEFFAARDRLLGSGVPHRPVGDVCEPWCFGAYALCNHIEWAESQSGVPFLKAESLGSPLLLEDKLSYITHSTHRLLAKSQLRSGDIIVATSGTIGPCAVIPEEMAEANSNQDTIKFRLPADEYDSYLTAAWLSSNIAQTFLRREGGGAVQSHIYLYNFKRLPLIRPDRRVQRYIGDKLRQAERLRRCAKQLDRQVFSTFDPLTADLPSSRKAWRVEATTIDPYRLNSTHYDSRVLDVLTRANSITKLISLGEVAHEAGIAGGATPLGATYPTSGVFFARVQNVRPLRMDLNDAVFITAEQDEQLRRSRCRANDIVLTITGYPGSAAVVMESDLPLNINQHSVRFATRDGWPAGFVAVAINSPFGKLQVDRLAIGGTRDALDYPSVKSLLIPAFDSETRTEVGKTVFRANVTMRISDQLAKAAKLLVEALIDGKLQESELSHAQVRLEQDDVAPDRAILARLCDGGIDATATKPLFPILDAYYETLRQLDDVEPVEEAV